MTVVVSVREKAPVEASGGDREGVALKALAARGVLVLVVFTVEAPK
jgi:hypothetical protein